MNEKYLVIMTVYRGDPLNFYTGIKGSFICTFPDRTEHIRPIGFDIAVIAHCLDGNKPNQRKSPSGDSI